MSFNLDKLSAFSFNGLTDDYDEDFSIEGIEKVFEKEHLLFNTMEILEQKVKDASSISLLQNGICYVNLIYDDGSVLVIHTSLNDRTLAQHFAYTKEGYLFDIDRYRYLPIDGSCDCVEITITKDNIYAEDEVITFINQFL